MNRREVLLSGAALSLLGTRAFAQSGGEIAIGAIWPFTGASAQVGTDAKHALETAVDIVNNAHDLDLPTAKNAGLAGLGNARIKLVFADHQGDPQKARAEAERLITQEKVVAIAGAFHSSASSTASVACERYSVPYVAADSSSPSLHTRGLKFFFRPAAHDEMFTAAMFDFLDAQKKAGKKVETIGIFFEDTIFGTDSSNVQRKLAAERGYKIVADIKYKSNSPSLTAEVQQLKSANPDVLMPSSYTTDAILLVKTMDELGYKPKNILAQAAGFADKAYFDAVADKSVGLISRASFSLDMAQKRPAIFKVNEMFKARAGRDLNDNTSRQLMAILVLADAIDRAKSTDGENIRAALAATDIPGERTIMPWKRVKFGADGQNADADPVLIQYIGGKFVTIFPSAVAVAEPLWPMNA
ncbi:ABC transporter substrate-binding protein [Bradyrhizobium sp. U87765 SZCCT0131]|uniref:ABC transporter substrate-binding protein n=1 Tax=unclassified Bradyrhizobium TaxID=2631580 RepID=UPI001BAAE809|nr:MULTISPECIES: ABC transporter substrate-binding protein [unclassified Bradyrhizobium]MBR1217564.1 ABC transporter substrate-binding protein [Bradyrhizobium sp. U87765 SZCCT0131]MBR1264838.1 ABC transporter substrate-binding protein [Bradyrhizobium sp. U87765 SZCCT0134]MBR1304820.1 ABC transporter substrate-binding protein [Bradyrhizobium sp. U87765 SZCCT0110]MBR1320607.1 ABC transporter substrate-binding protein [Bradyrhizobium sp. U87765 SZCCT0109]MBR1349027.1 ABC transporter substrate-bin